MRESLVEKGFVESLVTRGDVIVVGVSGGADSMVLLELLAALRTTLDLTLHVAHVNYGLRGNASELDERLVRERAKQLGVFVHIERTDAVRVGAASLEERARDIRHTFFKSVAKEVGARVIALGHNQDDQLETLLLRLLRGSGLTGLIGMQQREGMIIRPLLLLSRSAIRAYAHERGVPHRQDLSNRDVRFARNRVRHVLVPLLTKYFNPNIRETLTRSAEVIKDDEQFLDEFAATLYAKLVKDTIEGERVIPSINSDELMQLPLALQRRIIRAMSKTADPKTRPGHSQALDQALATLAEHRASVRFSLGEHLTLTRSKGTVRVTFESPVTSRTDRSQHSSA